ncbi:MAG TPA: (Fe-S)-binding protein [Nevskiaceae bacterium]|nr:(Fe-S)-binding protein [Nevskiaceae bacterium]
MPADPASSLAALRTRLLSGTDQCVKCGLCLPHCPTYALQGEEGASPRGRLALIQGLAQGRLDAGPGVAAHLDGCLSCRACEPVCPAQVRYGEMLDGGRQWLALQQPRRLGALRWFSPLLTARAGRALLRTLLALYHRSGLQTLVRRSRVLGHTRLARLEALLPARRAVAPVAADPGAGPAVAQLHIGCLGQVLDQAAVADLQAVFAAAGQPLAVPAGQGCCGALHQHAGDAAQARRLARIQRAVFDPALPVLALASGCGAGLQDGWRALGEPAPAVHDPFDWLAPRAGALAFAPTPLTVWVHRPCTQRHVLRSRGEGLLGLLGRVPGLRVRELPDRGCCGAAGLHMVQRPAAADALLAPLLDALEAAGPEDVVLSGNIGCALHLGGGLRRLRTAARPPPPVLHPARFLRRCLPAASPAARSPV